MDDATANEVRPRKQARLKALRMVVGWHALGAAVVLRASSVDAGQCHTRCGVDDHAFDGLMYFGQLSALVVFGLAAGVVAFLVAGYWRRRPMLIGTAVSAGVFFIIGNDLSLLL